jgi:hypothetical protein
MNESMLAHLTRIHHAQSKRISSWDQTGGNDDRYHIRPGETRQLAHIQGIGCVTHIWMTLGCDVPLFLRKAILRMYWDGESEPSVQVPIGDFFGMGHALTQNFWSIPLVMSPQDGKGMSCYFPMPFASEARIELENEETHPDATLRTYFYIDYEQYPTAPVSDPVYFHACFHRENPTKGYPQGDMTNEEWNNVYGTNLTGAENYVVLDAQGKGHYVGCHLDIHNLRHTHEWNWYGEGDDMIFIDGEPFPPSLHGTGTEDYFNTAWCPSQSFCAPFHGIIRPGGDNWAGKISLYRYHILDPIHFSKSIKVTLEHGHNNNRSDDWSSTAYWYQTEPHQPFSILPLEDRIPRPD